MKNILDELRNKYPDGVCVEYIDELEATVLKQQKEIEELKDDVQHLETELMMIR